MVAKKRELEEKARAQREEISQQKKAEAQMRLKQQMKKQEVRRIMILLLKFSIQKNYKIKLKHPKIFLENFIFSPSFVPLLFLFSC